MENRPTRPEGHALKRFTWVKTIIAIAWYVYEIIREILNISWQ